MLNQQLSYVEVSFTAVSLDSDFGVDILGYYTLLY